MPQLIGTAENTATDNKGRSMAPLHPNFLGGICGERLVAAVNAGPLPLRRGMSPSRRMVRRCDAPGNVKLANRRGYALVAAQTLAKIGKNRTVSPMNTVEEIKAAIEKLSPQELRELVAWFVERQASLNACDALFQVYDHEEQRK
jgi:hypothetical protein